MEFVSVPRHSRKTVARGVQQTSEKQEKMSCSFLSRSTNSSERPARPKSGEAPAVWDYRGYGGGIGLEPPIAPSIMGEMHEPWQGRADVTNQEA